MPAIIGLTGFKGAGKSEVRKYLVARYGFTSIAFADPLKGMLRSIGLTEEQLNGSQKETPCNQLQGITPRHAMQTLGTEWGRMMIADKLWISLWQSKVEACKTPIVADDARFSNEFDLIRQMGGKILRIVRPGLSKTSHISESAAADLDCDYGLTNNARLIDLNKAVDHAVQLFAFKR